MNRKQSDRPFHRIVMAISSVNLAAKFPEVHDEQKLREIMVEADYALRTLMEFRNLVSATVSFDTDLADALAPYVDAPEGGEA